jgi:hypothetical protein
MNATTPPTLSPEQAAALLLHPDGMVLLDLSTSTTAFTARPAQDVWESPTLLVLATHEDAVQASGQAAAMPNFLRGLTDLLNDQLAALHEAGEIPTEDDVRAVLMEMAHYEAEVIDLSARRAR